MNWTHTRASPHTRILFFFHLIWLCEFALYRNIITTTNSTRPIFCLLFFLPIAWWFCVHCVHLWSPSVSTQRAQSIRYCVYECQTMNRSNIAGMRWNVWIMKLFLRQPNLRFFFHTLLGDGFERDRRKDVAAATAAEEKTYIITIIIGKYADTYFPFLFFFFLLSFLFAIVAMAAADDCGSNHRPAIDTSSWSPSNVNVDRDHDLQCKRVQLLLLNVFFFSPSHCHLIHNSSETNLFHFIFRSLLRSKLESRWFILSCMERANLDNAVWNVCWLEKLRSKT